MQGAIERSIVRLIFSIVRFNDMFLASFVVSHICCCYSTLKLRIRVECAFGQLVHRWAILRAPMPMNTSIKKTVALVNALAKLHNFCINVQDEVRTDSSPEDIRNLMDSAEGFITLDEVEVEGIDTQIPLQLMDGGNHFDDVPVAIRRRINRDNLSSALPRTELLIKVVNSNMDRPSSVNRINR